MIVPINAALVTQAVVDIVKENPNLGGSGVRVERSEDPDQQPDGTGHIAIYRVRQRFPPRALGQGAGSRQQRISLVALISASNYASGADCEDALEQLLVYFCGALLSDVTLRGTVDYLSEEFEVDYDRYDKKGDIFVQTAAVYFTGLVNVRSTT